MRTLKNGTILIIVTFIKLTKDNSVHSYQHRKQHHQTAQCQAIIVPNFEECTWEHKQKEIYVSDMCRNQSVCGRKFGISYVRLMPYYEDRYRVEEMILRCCGGCAELRTVNEFTDTSQINMASLATSDFVYPFLADTNTEKIHGFYFVPMTEAPGVYYITRNTDSPQETLLALIYACADLWPVFTICILLCMISGFVVWISETWGNEEEFSRVFYFGMFDGFWWAFVSMTTVGYGDKVPHSWPGRVVSVIWILLGISICSIFTASLTSAIMDTTNTPIPQMGGRTVGCLKHRIYEASMIAQHGGRIVDMEEDNYDDGIRNLLIMLANDIIYGIALDKLLYNFFKIKLSNKTDASYDAHLEDQFFNSTIVTEVMSKKSDSLSYGLLVRHQHDNEYFRRYMTDNRLQVSACHTLRMNSFANQQPMKADVNIFSLEAGLFWPSFIITIGILLGIFSFGFLYENTRLVAICIQKIVKKRSWKAGEWVEYKHSAYKQYWLDVVDHRESVVGKTETNNRRIVKPLTENQLKNELAQQNINVMFMDNCDILILSDV